MQKISISHSIIKTIRKLKKKSHPNLIVIEGLSILEIAIQTHIDIEAFIYCEELIYSDDAIKLKAHYESSAKNVYSVSKKTYESVADKENSAGFIAIVNYQPQSIESVDFAKKNFVLVLNGLELPGNMGSIYRTAYAINVDLVMIVDCQTDVTSPKFIASSRGVFFDVPTIKCDYETAQKILLNNNYRIVLAEPELGTSYNHFNYDGKIAIVVGSERYGINKNWYSNPNEKVFIPMRENMKSLNVGIAASILLYEAATKKDKI